jgi:hypothetical protein
MRRRPVYQSDAGSGVIGADVRLSSEEKKRAEPANEEAAPPSRFLSF